MTRTLFPALALIGALVLAGCSSAEPRTLLEVPEPTVASTLTATPTPTVEPAPAEPAPVEPAPAEPAPAEPAPAEPAPVEQLDPQFRTCGDANDAGYGPYVSGVDGEYGWYRDRDGDGVVCEK